MIGQNIGKYRVLDRIGRGGMGTVYRAIDETLHREVAIKVLNAELNDPEVAKRFRSEAITVARLSHPGIATIYELFQHDGQWLMVMEFVRGETLERMVERMGALSPQRTAELCMQTLAALAHAHSMGVVHRDLKPANIMITETGAIKVMDFGIARVAGTEHLTSAGFMMGTPAYMAPEQVMGKEIDARADLYAIGVVFYRLTTGKLPFKGETPFAMAQSQVNDPPTPMGLFRSDLPPWVEQIVVRALAKSPEERFQSAVEFHEGFARSLAGLPIASAYTSSVSGDLLLTPPRPMPSGAFPRPMTASYPVPTPPQPAVQPVVPQPTPDVGATVLSPSTEVEMTRLSGPVATSPSAPAALPVESTSAATVPVPASASLGTAAMASPPATAPPPPVPAAVVAPRPATANKSGHLGLIVAAAIAVISIGSFLVFRSSPSAPLPPPIEVAAEPTPAPVEEPPAPEPIAPPPSAPAAPPGPVAGATPTRPATTADARGAGAGGARAAAPTASAPPAVAPAVPARVPIDDTLLEVPDVKLLIVNGRRTNDEDVTLRFANGEMALLAKKGGARVAALPYSSTLRATYTRARDPKWDTSIFGPFQNLDVGGVLRTSKHWLVLQASDAYLILRLEDKNWRAVLATVTARTNIEIARPVSNDKP